MEAGLKELVLGGEGLIGSVLVAALRAKGHEATSLDLKSGCDLGRLENTRLAACDRVWFLAWDVGGAKYLGTTDRQHEQYKHNCELCVRVFDALAQTGRPFLFTTTQLAGQLNAYGLTKLMAEHWAMQLGGKVARLWNVYGWEPPSTKSHVISDLVLSGLAKGQVECLTNGKERRRFLYKSDCVAGLIELFDGPQETADIAGMEWVTIGQVAEEIARQLGVEAVFGHLEGDELIVDPENLLPHWQPAVSLSDGISLVIADAQAFLKQECVTTG